MPPGKANIARNPTTSYGRCLVIARRGHRRFVIMMCFALFSFFIWAAFAELDKVTRGSGRIVALQQNKMVQHLEGGIIAQIFVAEGEKVNEGDVVMLIEDSFSQAELKRVMLDENAHKIKLARIDAEINGKDSFSMPKGLNRESNAKIYQNERQLFLTRKESLAQEIFSAQSRHQQAQLQLREFRSRYKNTIKEKELQIEKVASYRRLSKEGAVSRNDYLEQQSRLQQLNTRLSDLEHKIPQAESKMLEEESNIEEISLNQRKDIEVERSTTLLQIAKLEESITALRDRSQRSEVRAPVSGRINKLLFSTIGGVVRPGQALMQIVPDDGAIAIEARLSPKDRAEVWPGLSGIVKVSAYDFSLYGGLEGKVVEISPDALQDEEGEPYFRVRIEANSNQLAPDKPIVPGMLAQVDILSGKHTVLNYLTSPVRNLRDNAFRQ